MKFLQRGEKIQGCPTPSSGEKYPNNAIWIYFTLKRVMEKNGILQLIGHETDYLAALWQITSVTSGGEAATIRLAFSNDTSTNEVWSHSKIWSPVWDEKV